MNQEFITNSFEETRQIGKNFAQLLDGDELLCLYGNLGSGKTTFVQGLAAGLGIIRPVNSPTFIITREYTLKNDASAMRRFYHIDLYRIETKKEIINLGLTDIWNNPKNITAIEWAEKIKGLLPEKRIDLWFTYLDNDKRRIIIER